MTRAVRILAALAAMLAMGVLAPSAWASIAPTMTVSQSSTQAGASVALTTDITFHPSSSSDSVKNLTLTLPPGVLSNAAINHGACLKSTITTISACQVGTGTISYDIDALLSPPGPTPVGEPLPRAPAGVR